MAAGTPLNTLLLDQSGWDLVLDAANNIALAGAPYALAQDAASQIRLFRGEEWYNTVPGLPYYQQILGYVPPIALMKAQFSAAALLVPGVVAAVAFITSFVGRKISGEVQITDSSGVTLPMSF